ncbi:MAG: tRNA uridine-5-carboxymethylaminomethyl(34) synthesis enzyme MnmG [Planctomycetes bacterium]|nr:tRNA uridine-5-carboxymethylaminomethyl(34) synthesis enzyme MnmG [Planctomycetota bacterium]
MKYEFDIIVVGAGHAGCEAALAAARMGMETSLLTIRRDRIAQMSCNPAIGGLAKGQLVRELDALGGEMAKVTDATGIQFRMLNLRKGPAMRSPRAQADRKLYREEMRRRVEAQERLTVLDEVVDDLLVKNGKVTGVRTHSGSEYAARAVILTTGTFLKGLIHIGEHQEVGGRFGEPAAERLSDSLTAHGLKIRRLKTGTPPRLEGKTIDYSKMREQPGDPDPKPFSFSTKKLNRPQVPCYLTWTTPETHEILRKNLDRAPLFTGQIQSAGPRYCPSVELKIVRFPDKDKHQVFIEPEGLDTTEVYCNGLATSVPKDVQEKMVHSVPGLEAAEITMYGYAIEYDFAPPTQLKPSLETKGIKNLFHAGQINGTSGYEEAAVQGFMAGINAVLKLRGEGPLILRRDEAYIGVLIDDLVTKGTEEPYRMFTSRAEYRLLLRQDNADRRLMAHGHGLGLIGGEQFAALQEKEQRIAETIAFMESTRSKDLPEVDLAQYLRRPHVTFEDVVQISPRLGEVCPDPGVREQVQIELKYAGYIQRQMAQIRKFRKMEKWRIPDGLDYEHIQDLKREARAKLNEVRPRSLGQASRISGVTPADISVLMVYLTSKANRT